MLFLYRAAGEPEVSGNTQPFSDVPVTHNFYKAIQWGYESGIAVAYADGRFGVADSCKRAHAVYFLHKMDSWLNLSPVGKVGNSVLHAAEALRDAATGP